MDPAAAEAVGAATVEPVAIIEPARPRAGASGRRPLAFAFESLSLAHPLSSSLSTTHRFRRSLEANMSRFRLAFSFALVALLGANRLATAAEDHVFRHENVMGTSLELRVLAESEAAARWAEGRVLGEIDRLSKLFSGYDPSSEFSRWMATSGVPTPVSPELFQLLQASDDWRGRSFGAFDPRVEALSKLWTRTASLDRTPTEAERLEALALMSLPAWKLDPDRPDGRANLDLPDQPERNRQGVHRRCRRRRRPGS